jgi:hypothetical protein
MYLSTGDDTTRPKMTHRIRTVQQAPCGRIKKMRKRGRKKKDKRESK